jgi:hypothetical protein
VEIWNGGIPGGAWLRNGQAQMAQPLASRHLPLGILDDAQFDPECVTAVPGRGERILFFSDGLVEAAARAANGSGRRACWRTSTQWPPRRASPALFRRSKTTSPGVRPMTTSRR